MTPNELHGHLVDVLNSAPGTRDHPDTEALAEAVLPLLFDVAATELSMAADAMEYCVENPEMPWAQGVLFVVEELRERARVIDRQGRAGGSV